MPPRFLPVKPNSPEWLHARLGRITASRIRDVMDFTQKGAEGAKRRRLRLGLTCERLIGRAQEGYVSPAMDWGTEMEPIARAAYEAAFGGKISRPGFALHPTMNCSGASPDCLVDDDGGLEIKCPEPTTHLAYKDAGVVPEEYIPQMIWNMVCCERKWWDFVSFDPRFENHPDLQIFCVRLEFDEKLAAQYTEQVAKLNDEIVAMIGRVKGDIPNRCWCGLDSATCLHAVRTFDPKTKQEDPLMNDPSLGITESDLPDWAREERGTL